MQDEKRTEIDRKLVMYKQELKETEKHYIQDLEMVREVFRKQFLHNKVLSKNECDIMFCNLDELISVARHFYSDISANSSSIGLVVLRNLDRLTAFVTFCEGQKGALDFLEQKEKSSPTFRAAYMEVCRHSKARGLPLSYFLLLPMTRVTKYPLILEKLLQYSSPNSPDIHNLEKAHEALKGLCADVNRVVTEVESLQMLYWCQHHVKVDAIRPKLIFHSQTNSSGGRKFLHSGILYKAKSNRLLVGLLFNDFLMLTTPDEQIDHPDSFKLSKSSDLLLSLYKWPIMLKTASLQIPAASTGSESAEEARLLAISNVEDVINFKCVSSNARILWNKQLEKAIADCKQQEGNEANSSERRPSRVLGRLLIELVSLKNFSPQQLGPNTTVVAKLKLGDQINCKQVDIGKKEKIFTTQFLIESHQGVFMLALYLEQTYAPDLCIGTVEVPLHELIKNSGSHRGPILRQELLVGSELEENVGEKRFAIVKFVVLFDD